MKEALMPYINCRVMEGVLSDDQKAEIAESITETIVSVVGEPVRGLTWVVIDDMASGNFTIGGRPITTEGVKELLTGAPAGA
jgi:4-oxalocrotonate tautomerase